MRSAFALFKKYHHFYSITLTVILSSFLGVFLPHSIFLSDKFLIWVACFPLLEDPKKIWKFFFFFSIFGALSNNLMKRMRNFCFLEWNLQFLSCRSLWNLFDYQQKSAYNFLYREHMKFLVQPIWILVKLASISKGSNWSNIFYKSKFLLTKLDNFEQTDQKKITKLIKPMIRRCLITQVLIKSILFLKFSEWPKKQGRI